MRLRTGLIAASVLVALLSPVSPKAHAFGGYASAPQEITSTAIAGGLRVSWNVPADVDTGVLGYRVEYSTTGNSSWNLATTTGSATFTYDIQGLSSVLTYVRVAATTSAGVGMYGYPWTKLYETTSKSRNSGDTSFTYSSGFGLGGSDAAANLNSAGAQFSRIRYQITASVNYSATLGAARTTDTATADFYKWSPGTNTTSFTVAPTYSNLQFPVLPASGAGVIIQANVTDLNVWSTSAKVATKKGANGRLEIWPWDYITDLSGLTNYSSSPNAADGLKYDFDDTVFGGATPGGSYGSFQVHNLDDGQVVFAWNSHGSSTTPDIGFGNKTDRGQRDSTFCHDNNTTSGYCQEVAGFRMQVFVNIAVTPLADATPPTVTRVDSKSYAKNGDSITVQSTELGTVYLVKSTVSVSTLANITSAAANQKNSVSISAINTSTTLTTSGLIDGSYNLYAVDLANNLSTPISSTITMDSTAPSVVSIAVQSGGSIVFLTLSENVTHGSMGDTMFIVNDGGGQLTVGSTGVGGNIVQVGFTRTIPAGATVSLAYNPLIGLASGRWVDSAGNELAAITTQNITNNSTAGVTATLSVPSILYKGTSATSTVAVGAPGKVSFTLDGKRIPGCFNKIATGTVPITVSCTFKASVSGLRQLGVRLVPTNSSIATKIVAPVSRYILRRTSTR